MAIVTVQPRDAILTFENSCNCCMTCLCCCEDTGEKVEEFYVNRSGELEQFKAEKAKDKVNETAQRALGHLATTLEKRVSKFKGDPLVFQFRVSSILDRISKNKKITLLDIEEINNAMIIYYTERTKPEHKAKN